MKMTAGTEMGEYWIWIGNNKAYTIPSGFTKQNTTGQQILIGNRYLVGSSGWRSLSWSSTPEDDFQKAVSCQHQRRPGPLSNISSCVGATPAAEAPLGRRHHDADGELIRPHAARIRDVTCRHSCVFMKMKNHVVVAGWVELWWINPSSVGAVCFMSFFWLHLLPCYSSPVHLSASSPTLCHFLLFPALPCFVIPGGLPLWDPLHFLPPR